MTNVELLKQIVIEDLGSNPNHTRRLLDLRGIRNWERVKLDLMDAGFYFYINAGKLNQFKHYAIVRTRQGRGNYIGDIPDFAIDKAELALSLGICEITIHSMKPLPVARVKTDPIMVGWLQIPQESSVGAFTHGSHYEWEGVVISVWDNEKELEL